MSWSRRRVLGAVPGLGLGLGLGLGTIPWLGCAGRGSDRRPPQTPSSVAVELPRITRGTFGRGSGLYLVEDHGVPLVAMAVAVAAGHRHERSQEQGRAAVAASMVLEGMEGGDRAALLGRYGDLGATPYTSVGRSLLVLGSTVHRDDAVAALRLMLGNLRRPTGADDAFERVVREHRESLRAARGSAEVVAGLGLLLASQGVEPPASLLSEGTAESLAALTPEQARAWLALRLRLDGLTFLMAGDVDEPQILRWIDAATDDWPPASEPAPAIPPVPERLLASARPRIVLVHWPQLPQAIVALGGPREPYGHPDEPAQTLADGILLSVMHHELRQRRRISYGVQQRGWNTRLGVVTQLWAKVEPTRVGPATEQLRAFVERFEQGALLVDEAVIDDRQAAMIAMMHDYHGAEPALGQLRRLAEADLPARTPQQRLAWLRSLDAPQVTAALRQLAHPERLRWCIVGDSAVLEQARSVLPREGVVERTPAELFERAGAA
ncbi:MAG: insulinase family protein [Myxococcota bacterium]